MHEIDDNKYLDKYYHEDFFIPYNQHGLKGYYIAVRNSLNDKLESELIPEKAKELYLKEFGEKHVYDFEFLDWYDANSKYFY